MERLTTDTPQTNMEILANFAYAKDKEVHLIYGDGLEDVTLADYIVEHAKSDFDCSTNREDVINGDSCWECDCPLAVLNAVATQAAELRSRLKKYEDAEEQGRLIVLPCKVGDILYAPTRNFVSEFRVTQFDFGGYNEPYLWAEWYLCNGITGNFRIDGIGASEIGKSVFLSREEAEKALEGMK